jgi:DNA invertase Pin-like site-specific DNA recombinase
MLDEVREGDMIHVESLDRIALDLPDLLSLVEKLGRMGVGLVFHSENITIPGNMADPMRENAIKSMKILSITDGKTKNERKDHVIGARRIGTRVGRPSSVTEQQKNDVRKFLTQEPQMSISQISRETGVPKTTCFRIKAALKEELEGNDPNNLDD